MTTKDAGILIVRAAALLFGAAMILLPLMVAGTVQAFSFVLAATFFVAAVAPRTLAPHIGKGVASIATFLAIYDPPSTVSFHPDRWLVAAPFLAFRRLLAVPQLSQTLARTLFRR
ncbi:MAG: hypothetical protein KBA31_20685 [Alphaproteobacteria bacterium]|nr:hypothetical protein [Alphaproteobacteria bacterium]